MDSDDDLLVSMMDTLEEEEEGMEEDWTDTNWAQPVTDVATLLHPGTSTENREQGKSHAKADTKWNKIDEPEDPSVVKRMLLNDNKAGMEGLDKERINQVIHEASKGSKFYENERLKEEQMKKRIAEQKKKVSFITDAQLKEGLIEANRLLEDFDQQRDLSRTIVHTDMDAFYAAVEMRDRPELKDKPMAVGGNDMLSTSNYHARKFGVRAAMPGFIGKKLCPDLILVPTNFDKYTVVSKDVRAIFTQYDPNFCPMSLDEAYLDITEHLEQRKTMSELERTYICRDTAHVDSKEHCLCDLNDIAKNHGNNLVDMEESGIDLHSYLLGETTVTSKCRVQLSDQKCDESCAKRRPICPVCHKELPPFYCVVFGLTDEDAVNELRMRIEQKTQLTASAGIAPNMMLAKVCSDKNKPNGQYKVPATKADVINFIKDLPTRKISGIGKVSEAMLNALGVYRCMDLYNKRALLYHLYSSISFNYFMRICLGIGSTRVERDSERKSMSTERTFAEISRPADLYRKCEELTECLAADLKEEQLKGKTVGLKIKTVKFEVKTKALTLREYTSDKDVMLRAANELLRTEIQACAPHPLRLRLMGVRMSNLLSERHCVGKKQKTIFGAFKKLTQKTSKTEETGLSLCSSSEFVPVKELKTLDGKRIPENEGNHNSMLGYDDALDIAATHSSVLGDCSDRLEKDKDCIEVSKERSVDDANIIDKPVSKDARKLSEEIEKEIDGIADSKAMAENEDKIEQVLISDFDERLNEKTIQEDEVVHKQSAAGEVANEVDSAENKIDIHSDEVMDTITIDPSVASNAVEVIGIVCRKIEAHDSGLNDAHTSNLELRRNATTETVSDQTSDKAIVATPNRRTTRSGLVSTSERKRVIKRRNSKRDKVVSYNCPVCQKDVQCCSLTEFNSHVDECLESQNNNAQSKHEQLVESKTKIETDAADKTVPISGELANKIDFIGENAVKERRDRDKCDDKNNIVDSNAKADEQPGERKLICENETENACYTKERVHTKEDKVSGISNEEDMEVKIETLQESDICPQNHLTTSSICETGTVMKMSDENTDVTEKCIETMKERPTEIGLSTEKVQLVCKEDKVHECPTLINDTCDSSKTTEDCASDTYLDKNTSGKSDLELGTVKEHSVIIEEVNNNGTCFARDTASSYNETEVADDKEEEHSQPQGLLVCPVCNIEQRSASLMDFNDHVDSCLSRGTITEILREQRKKDSHSHKRHSVSPLTPGSSQPSKRRKTILPQKPISCRSIVSFFKEK